MKDNEYNENYRKMKRNVCATRPSKERSIPAR